jgi:hypothetical protein
VEVVLETLEVDPGVEMMETDLYLNDLPPGKSFLFFADKALTSSSHFIWRRFFIQALAG